MRLSARFTKVSTTHEGLHTLGPSAVHYGRRRAAWLKVLKQELRKRGCEAEIGAYSHSNGIHRSGYLIAC